MFTSRRYRSGTLAIAFAVAVVCGTACTKAPSPARPSGSVSITATQRSTEAPTSSSAPPSSTSRSARPTASKTSTAPTKPPGQIGCATSQLTVQVQRLSGAAGHQYANLVFINKSNKVCTIVGFPGAVLLLSHAQLGKAAQRSSKPSTPVAVKPGAQASALLTDASTCNANLSDSIQVIVPNQTEKVVLPLSLRGCPLTVDPVAAG